MSLLVPSHIAASQEQQKRPAPPPIPSLSSEALQATSTDDFLSREEAIRQFALLDDYTGVIPKPTGHHLIVLSLKPPETLSETGLVLAAAYREQRGLASPQGIIIAIGAGAYPKKRFPEGHWCAIGDRVLFQKYAGREHKLSNDQRLFVLNDDEVMAVLDSIREE